MNQVKITVLKTTFDRELAREYGVEGLTSCPMLSEGQVFYADYAKMCIRDRRSTFGNVTVRMSRQHWSATTGRNRLSGQRRRSSKSTPMSVPMRMSGAELFSAAEMISLVLPAKSASATASGTHSGCRKRGAPGCAAFATAQAAGVIFLCTGQKPRWKWKVFSGTREAIYLSLIHI